MDSIKPTFLNIPSLSPKTEATVDKLSEDEIQLIEMSKTRGWSVFKEIANNVLRELDEVTSSIISSGASFEEIGKNTLVTTLAKDIINRLLNKVDDVRGE